MDISLEIRKVNEQLVNKAITAALIFLVPSVGLSLLRSIDIGWQPIFSFHVGVALAIILLFLFRKKLDVKLKGIVFLSLFMVLSLVGSFFYKLTGGIYLMFVSMVVATLFYGIWGGMAYLGVFFVFFTLFGYLHLENIIGTDLDFNVYFNLPSTWMANAAGYFFGSVIIIYTISLYNKLYKNSLSELVVANNKLNESNKKLFYSEERFKKFMDNYPYPITIKNEALENVYWNKAFEYQEKLGLNEKELYNTTDYFPEEIDKQIEALDRKVFKTGKFTEAELGGILRNSKELYSRLIKFPLEDIDGNKLLGTITIDVTERVLAIKELQLSEKKYRSLIEGNIIGFLYYDKNRQIIDCNNSTCILLGYERSELIGMNIQKIIPQKWYTEELITAIKNKLDTEGNTGVFEKELVDKNGKIIPIEVNIHKQDLDGQDCFGVFIRDISEKKDFEQKLFEVTIQSEEKERERYARELHDVLGPYLSTSMIYVHSLQSEKDDTKRNDYLSRVSDLLTDAHKSIREISNNFSPDILKKYGIVQAVRSFIEKLNVLDKIEFDLKSNLKVKLNAITEVTLYRTIVELINNSLKYAECSKISLVFLVKENNFYVEYADNGVGFNYSENFGRGFGLINISNRINRVNGDLSYKTTPGEGVCVSIKIENIAS